MKISYRAFENSDGETVAGLIKKLYEEIPSEKSMTLEKIQRTFAAFSKNPSLGEIKLLEKKGEIFGYAILVNFWSNEFGGNILIIDEIYIKEEFRSLGIASDFINHLAKKRHNHSVAIQLEVSPENVKASELYRKLGFEPHKNNMLDLDLLTSSEEREAKRK